MLIESSVVLDVVRCRNCDVPGRFRTLHRMIENLHFSVFSLASYDGVEALPRFVALRYDFAIIRWTRALVVAAFQDTFEIELFDLNPLITVARKAHLSHRKSRGSRDNLCRTFASTKSPRKPEKPRSSTRKRSEFSPCFRKLSSQQKSFGTFILQNFNCSGLKVAPNSLGIPAVINF